MADKNISVLITGAAGQLGQSLRRTAPQGVILHLFSREQMDISELSSIDAVFEEYDIDFVVNCAAFTAVDLAESMEEEAYLINAEAVNHLAKACNRHDAALIHISSDYVYDNDMIRPLVETDRTSPESVYAKSKLKGDLYAIEECSKAIVLRTSWLYSEYGTNFVKTMLRLGRERDELRVVADQHGIPTYAHDLANAIYRVILSEPGSYEYGIYHFANSGPTTWFDFARTIFIKSNIAIPIIPIDTAQFPTPAKRPTYSVLDSTKFSKAFSLEIRPWQNALSECLLRVAEISNSGN
jgi:dTDP-4-dehydrorhamnose reductase